MQGCVKVAEGKASMQKSVESALGQGTKARSLARGEREEKDESIVRDSVLVLEGFFPAQL